MNISSFIRDNMEAILQAWEDFAKSIQPKYGNMSVLALRDDAKEVMEEIADELETLQSMHMQAEKSKGRSLEPTTTTATRHGLERLKAGFGIAEMISEYRALRASVIRLWDEMVLEKQIDLHDLIRFNEAIDQRVHEAVASFTMEAEMQTRQFDTVLSSSPDHNYILDHEGKFLYANDALLKTLHISRDELLGKSYFGLNVSETPDDLHKTVKKIIQTATRAYGEVNYRLPPGEVRCFEYVYTPVLDDDKIVTTVACTERDITDRKQGEDTLYESEELLSRAQEIAQTGSWKLDLTANRLTWSDEVYRIFGCEPQEFSATYVVFLDFVHPDDRTMVDEAYSRSLQEGSDGYEIEHRIVRRNSGEVRYVHERCVHKRDTAGTTIQSTGMVQDITDRKRTEEALAQKSKLLEEAQVIANLGSWEWDIVHDTWFFSEQWKKIHGVSDNDLDTRRLIEIAHPKDAPYIEKAFADAKEQRKTYDIEHRIIRADNQEIRYIKAFGEVEFDQVTSRPVRMVGTAQDITERKQAEETREKLQLQLNQAQKAESLGRMAGAIAHIFNNQLGVVIGTLEMVIEDLPQDVELVTDLTPAMQEARKAAQVSGLMLTYLGQTTGSHVPLDLSESCRQSLPSLRTETSHGPILKVNLPSPGPTVKANADQIQQILTNLVTNAREAVGEKQGTVTLTVKTVPQTEISEVHRHPADWQAQNATYACLEVTDTGYGIANEAIDKVFDPFYSTKFTGRGLGLPVVFGIVWAHDGVITVASEEHGSTFRVFLPLSAEKIPGQLEKTSQPFTGEGSGTVLLIEDEEMIRNMAKTMILRLGYTALTAKDGIEAMEMFTQHQDEICCVVSDVSMPGMNGWETLTALRKLSPDTPVILSSGYDEAQSLIDDYPERPQAFLHKPYQMMELQAVLAKVIEN